ncbi:hypothetical protein CF116_13505 [Aeromonas veronii]|nr:hypothetical protein CF116_13505 [Aeromonas veronii]
MIFLYKKAHQIKLEDVQAGAAANIQIPYQPTPLKIASMRNVNASSVRQKFVGNPTLELYLIESDVPCFKI